MQTANAGRSPDRKLETRQTQHIKAELFDPPGQPGIRPAESAILAISVLDQGVVHSQCEARQDRQDDVEAEADRANR